MPPVQLGPRLYASAEDAWADVKKRYLPNQSIGPVPQADLAFITAIARRHPDPKKLQGWDGKTIEVMKDGYGGKCFGLRISKDELRDFSAKTCIFKGAADGPNVEKAPVIINDPEWDAAAIQMAEFYGV